MEFAIQIDLSPLLKEVQHVITAGVLPAVRQAVWGIAQQAQLDWLRAIYEAPHLWSGEKEEYADSVDLEETGPFAAVAFSDYEHASEIEEGRPAYDLKKMLQTSNKTRISKKTGKRYLIIPFRHNVADLPKAVHIAAKALSPTRVTGMTTRVSGTGAVVPQRIYAWGAKLKRGALPQMLPQHANMYRFDVSVPNSPRSAYMTFRTMTEGSSGWIIPAQPGQHLVRKVVAELRPRAELAFAEAIRRSIAAA